MKDPEHRRSTITKAADGEGKFIRNSGAQPHYGHVVVRVEPNGRGLGISITKDVSGTAVPERYLKSVADGLNEALRDGVVPGRSVVDIIVRIVGGSFHETESSEIDFKMAAIFALKDAMKNAEPIAIE